MGEYILYHAKIWTAEKEAEWADAMWVSGDKILAVGAYQDMEDVASAHVRRIDMNGQMIIPSFVDCHVHITTVARSSWLLVLDKDSYADLDAMLADIGKYAKQHPVEEVPYIYATPCPQTWMEHADKTMLDRYVSDRPVLLCDEGFHSCLINSRMLELLEVDEHTPYDPTTSMNYARDAHNVPTGIVYEHRYEADLPKMYEKIRWCPPDQSDPAVIGPILKQFNDYGITAVLDGFTEGDETFEGLKRIEEKGELHMYYRGNSLFKKLSDLPDAIEQARRWNEKYQDSKMQTECIKLFLDGTNELGTAALMEPFVEDPDNYGVINMEEKELTEAMLQINEAKLDLQIHMVGDRAFHTAVNAVENAKKKLEQEGKKFTSRVTLLHCELTKPEDRRRAAELGIYINITPHWNGGIFGDAALKIVGKERFDTFYSFRDFIRYGAVLSCSSDIVSIEESDRANPFAAMQIAATRRDPQSCFEERQPASEKLPVRDMMLGFTIEGAKCMHMEKEIGSLAKGKKANFCVLNRNVFEVPVDKLGTTKAVTVVFEGSPVKGGLPY